MLEKWRQLSTMRKWFAIWVLSVGIWLPTWIYEQFDHTCGGYDNVIDMCQD